VELLDEAWSTMKESHRESYRVVKAVNIRGTAIAPVDLPWTVFDDEDADASAKVA
jgi:hypothetical protein